MALNGNSVIVSQRLYGHSNAADREDLRILFNEIADRLNSVTFNSAALRIKGGSASAIVQTNAASAAIAGGVPVTKATATDLPALVGTVTNAKFNVFCFYIDSAAALTTQMGIEGATLAAVQFPPTQVGKAQLGYVIVNPTGTGNFVGGTTVLDDATVVPNAVFVNTLGAFDCNLFSQA